MLALLQCCDDRAHRDAYAVDACIALVDVRIDEVLSLAGKEEPMRNAGVARRSRVLAGLLLCLLWAPVAAAERGMACR
ncbi:MAG: hypothetical protein ACE5JD_01795 [Candidatus Methylomirabilia bacterium]